MKGYIKGTSAGHEMEAIRAAFARAVAAIRADAQPDHAFSDASALGELARELGTETAGVRAWIASELHHEGTSLQRLADYLGISKARTAQLVREGERKGNTVPDPGTDPEPATVALAIITSPLGVLIERRNDKIPPWTFPAGEMLPGESPVATLLRRVPEETGLTITTGDVIGRRIHPRTGRYMIYVSATAKGTDAVVGDPDDLAEVRWASADETRELMPDMFPAVRAYLDGQSTAS